MRLSLAGRSRLARRLADVRSWLPFAGGVKDPEGHNAAFEEKDSIEEQEARAEDLLRRSSQSVEALRLASALPQPDLDQMAARGFLKTTRPYRPPPDLPDVLRDLTLQTAEAQGVGELPEDWRSVSLADLGLKFALLEAAGERLGRRVPSSYLHQLRTAGDVADFYALGVENVTEYVGTARRADLPGNLGMVEEEVAFHPEDREAWHGGVTAFPGLSRVEPVLRHQRLYRQFRGKGIASHFDEEGFDYSAQGPPDAPWSHSAAAKADRIREDLKARNPYLYR